MRHIIALCGVAAAMVLLFVSAAMNWRFGYSLGRTELDGLIYASASAAADCLKALAPFFFFAALRNRMWSQAVTAAAVGIVVTAYSLTSALGHAALNRSDTTGERLTEAQTYERLRGDLRRAQEQLSWIPAHRPPAMVATEIERLKTQRIWTTTEACRLVDGQAARTFCQKYQVLAGELESGRKAETLEARIAEVQSRLTAFQGKAVGGDADPQAAVLAKLFGLRVDQVQLGLTIFVAVLLEVGSGMGLYMAFSLWRIHEQRELPPGENLLAIGTDSPRRALPSEPIRQLSTDGESHANDDTGAAPEIGRFVEETIRRREGAVCAATSLYERYLRWCAVSTIAPLSLPAFARAIGAIGFSGQKRNGEVHYMGLELIADGAWRKVG